MPRPRPARSTAPTVPPRSPDLPPLKCCLSLERVAGITSSCIHQDRSFCPCIRAGHSTVNPSPQPDRSQSRCWDKRRPAAHSWTRSTQEGRGGAVGEQCAPSSARWLERACQGGSITRYMAVCPGPLAHCRRSKVPVIGGRTTGRRRAIGNPSRKMTPPSASILRHFEFGNRDRACYTSPWFVARVGSSAWGQTEGLAPHA